MYIQVFFQTEKQPLATITYGWESLSFYKKKFPNQTDSIQGFKGPALALASQSKYAETLLKFFKEAVLQKNYIERLKSHYTMFKKMIKADNIPYISESGIGRNERCPCGSGKKYKKCCGG